MEEIEEFGEWDELYPNHWEYCTRCHNIITYSEWVFYQEYCCSCYRQFVEK
jgi:hypothetical protein